MMWLPPPRAQDLAFFRVLLLEIDMINLRVNSNNKCEKVNALKLVREQRSCQERVDLRSQIFAGGRRGSLMLYGLALGQRFRARLKSNTNEVDKAIE